MLTQIQDVPAVLAALTGDRIRRFTLDNFTRSGEDGHAVKALVDDPANPSVLLAHAGTNFAVLGAIHRLNAVMKDLLDGNVEQAGGWPDAGMLESWENHTEGRRGIFLNTAPYSAWRACIIAGFEPHPEDRQGQVAYQWYWEGAPRFAALVEHPCRVVHGPELFELMRRAVHYDPEGSYIRQCLEHGPSFVCEVDGEPVCWSCTHLNGTMGMIFTPEDLRRSGYARSLAAFQLDHMLGRDGLACCHVIDYNTASMGLVQGLGAQCIPEPLVWRMVWWPGEAPPPAERPVDAPPAAEPQAGDDDGSTVTAGE